MLLSQYITYKTIALRFQRLISSQYINIDADSVARASPNSLLKVPMDSASLTINGSLFHSNPPLTTSESFIMFELNEGIIITLDLIDFAKLKRVLSNKGELAACRHL